MSKSADHQTNSLVSTATGTYFDLLFDYDKVILTAKAWKAYEKSNCT